MKIKSIIFITSFASGFGPLTGFPIYWWQFFIICAFFMNKIKVNIFFFIVLIYVFLVTFLRFDLIGQKFMGAIYPIQSIESYLQLVIVALLCLIIKQMSIKEIDLPYWLISLFILYGFLELILRELNLNSYLSVLHVNPKGAIKQTPSFTGREHSYGALCALLLLALVTAKMKIEKGYKKLLGFVCIISLVFILFSLKSKAAMIGLVLYLIIYCFVTIPKRVFILGFIIFLFISIAILYVGYLIFNEYVNHILTLSSISAKTRFAGAITGIEIIKNYPFFGVGLGNFTIFFPKYVDPMYVEHEIARMMTKNVGGIDPFNFPIGWIAETGMVFFIITFLCFLSFAKYPARSDFVSSDPEVRFIALFTVFATCSLFPSLISLYSFVSPQIFIFFGLMLKLKEIKASYV